MPYVLKGEPYDIYIGNIDFNKDGSVGCYCVNSDEEHAHKFRTAKAAEKFRQKHCSDYYVVYVKPVPKNRPFTYKVLMEEARKMYKRIAVDSEFCAHFDTREFIASKIDECVDVERNKKALAVREWDEYKEKYAPMTKAEYESQKKWIKEQCKQQLAELEKDWNTRGKNNPNFHKV